MKDALYGDWIPTVLGGSLAVIGLLLAAGGLYGADGGIAVVYKVDTTGQETVLYSFTDQLSDTAGKAVKTENQNYVEGSAPGIGHQCVQTGAAFLGPTGSVRVNLVERPTPLCQQNRISRTDS